MSKHRYNPDSCTACTTCMAFCPVTLVTRKFRGPKMTGPALERFRLSEEEAEQSLDYCSNCKNCDISCPSGVPVSTLTMLAKAEFYKTHRHSLRDWLLSHNEVLARMAGKTPALSNLWLNNFVTRAILQQIGISGKVSPPRYAAKTFTEQFQSYRQQPFNDKIVFFPGCFVNYYDPVVGMDLVAVMQANEIEVVVPALQCCGSPLAASGYLDEAKEHAKGNMEILRSYVKAGLPVITCCTSCSLMLKQENQELFELDGLAEVAARVYDVSEFLMELHEKGRLNMKFKQQSGRFLYHAPCHLRAQGIGRPGLELLGLVPGIQVTDADAGCCGMSGNYGFKDDKYEIAMAIGQNLFDIIKASGVETVFSDCGACRLQITHATGIKTAHPLSMIRAAYE